MLTLSLNVVQCDEEQNLRKAIRRRISYKLWCLAGVLIVDQAEPEPVSRYPGSSLAVTTVLSSCYY